jgi:hypothetical protein
MLLNLRKAQPHPATNPDTGPSATHPLHQLFLSRRGFVFKFLSLNILII